MTNGNYAMIAARIATIAAAWAASASLLPIRGCDIDPDAVNRFAEEILSQVRLIKRRPTSL